MKRARSAASEAPRVGGPPRPRALKVGRRPGRDGNVRGEFVIVCGHVTGVRAAEVRGSRGRAEGRESPTARSELGGWGGRGARR